MDTQRLGRLPLFAGLPKSELADLAMWMDEVDIPEGKVLVSEGTYAHEFVVIASGTAAVTVGGRPVNELAAGDFFGEIALLASPVRTATVRTTSPVRAIVMTAVNFRAMTREKPEVARRLEAVMAERLSRSG